MKRIQDVPKTEEHGLESQNFQNKYEQCNVILYMSF